MREAEYDFVKVIFVSPAFLFGEKMINLHMSGQVISTNKALKTFT
jgi:hypothetical protein